MLAGYMNIEVPDNVKNMEEILRKKSFCLECSSDNFLMSDKTFNIEFVTFIKDILRSSILKMAKQLSEVSKVECTSGCFRF